MSTRILQLAEESLAVDSLINRGLMYDELVAYVDDKEIFVFKRVEKSLWCFARLQQLTHYKQSMCYRSTSMEGTLEAAVQEQEVRLYYNWREFLSSNEEFL